MTNFLKTLFHLPMTFFAKKNLFVILNAVKDLLFAMLLRPVQSANRSFVPQDDKLFKNVISPSGFSEISLLGMMYLKSRLVYTGHPNINT
jgi:hypothetical protein